MASPVPPRLLYIGGEWVAPVKGGSLPVINPATEKEFARIPNATSEDVDAAVAAATAAFKSGHWSKTTGAYRAKYLKAIATKVRGCGGVCPLRVCTLRDGIRPGVCMRAPTPRPKANHEAHNRVS